MFSLRFYHCRFSEPFAKCSHKTADVRLFWKYTPFSFIVPKGSTECRPAILIRSPGISPGLGTDTNDPVPGGGEGPSRSYDPADYLVGPASAINYNHNHNVYTLLYYTHKRARVRPCNEWFFFSFVPIISTGSRVIHYVTIINVIIGEQA